MLRTRCSAPLHLLGGPRLHPKVEAALEPIGWPRVKGTNFDDACRIGRALNRTGGRISEGVPQAKEQLRALTKLCEALISADDGLTRMSADAVSTVEHWSRVAQEMSGLDASASIEGLRDAISSLAPGLLQLREVLEHEVGNSTNGRPRRVGPLRIAKAVAEVHVLGLGKAPTYGNLEDGRGASGVFCRALDGVLRALGIPPGDVAWLAKQAVDEMTHKRLTELMKRRAQPWWRDRESPSLFRLVE